MKKIPIKRGGTLILDGYSGYFEDAAKKETFALDGSFVQAIALGLIDADGAVFFQRQLEYIKARSYDVQYADLMAREVFPVSNEAGPGVSTITYRTYDQVGSAKIINAYAKDLPRADIEGKETSVPVRSLGIAYGYNIDEIAAAQYTGMPLDQRRANAAMRAMEETINKVAFYGDAEHGLFGLFNHPNVPVSTVTGGAWASKTPDQILFDINDLFATIFEVTKMKERPNSLRIPPKQYSYIASTARSATSDTTILAYLVANSPYLTSMDSVKPLNECASENNPLFTEDVMFAYDQNPDKMQLEIPVEPNALPVQIKGLEYEVPMHGRIGGLNIYYPLSVAIAKGI